MKITVNQIELENALTRLAAVVDKKPPFPILSHILVQHGNDNSLVLLATDLTDMVKVEIRASVEDPVNFTIPFFDFVKFVGIASNEIEVEVNLEEQFAMCSSGKRRVKITGLFPQDEYPPVDFLSDKSPLVSTTVVASDLYKAFKAVTPFVCTENNRPILSQFHLDFGDKLLLTGADGYALAQYTMRSSLTQQYVTNFSSNIGKAIATAIAKDLGIVEIGVYDGYSKYSGTNEQIVAVFLDGGKTTYFCNVISGRIPAWVEFIPREKSNFCTITVVSFLEALKDVGKFLNDIKSVLVKHSDDVMTLTSPSKETSIEADIDVSVTGSPVYGTYKHTYMLGVATNLKASGVVNVCMYGNGNDSPLLLESGELQVVIMPML